MNRLIREAGVMILMAALVMAGGGSGYVLHVFGNANMDGTIDEMDLEYVREIIAGEVEDTALADANFDGQVNEDDLIQIQNIIDGQENQITIIDGNNLPITVQKPVERIIVEYLDNAEMMQILKKTDRVVGVDIAISKTCLEFPDLCKRTCVGAMYKDPDYEAILKLEPDVLLTFSNTTADKQKSLPGVSVVFAGLYYPDLLNPETSLFTDGVMKLGYILDSRDEAADYIGWHTGLIEQLKSQTEAVSEADKPSVLIAAYPETDDSSVFTYAKIDTLSQMLSLAGGRSIAQDLPQFLESAYRIEVDPEWVIQENPDYIILLVVPVTYSGLMMDPPSGYETDDSSGMEKALEEFKSRPEFSTLDAVKNGRVYIISGNLRNDATKGLLGSAYLAKIFHAQAFKDLDPEALHQEYLTDILGLDYDLNKHGVFIYPPLAKEDGTLAGVPDS